MKNLSFKSIFKSIKALIFKCLARINRPQGDNAYQSWLKQHEKCAINESIVIRRWVNSLSSPVLIAVVMPVYNTNIRMLKETIASVRSQLYPYWQLIIVDDNSSDPRIKSVLESAAAKDSRVRIIYRAQRGHISACTNTALEETQAPWVVFLDHDDILSQDSLAWIARTYLEKPESMLMYSDEDKMGLCGKLMDPYFKSDWNPVLMEGHNMICHLSAYKTDLVKDVGGLRVGFEGAQDYDLALRCVSVIKREQIIHIPRVLYHWRRHRNSTSLSLGAKPYAVKAAETAVMEHYQRVGISVLSVQTTPYGIKPTFAMPPCPPLVSIIIPTRDNLEVLRPCIESLIAKTDYKRIEVIIIDNGSRKSETKLYFDSIKLRYGIRILRCPGEFNYSRLNNFAAAVASGDLLCLMNNDIEVIQPGWLQELVHYVQRDCAGAIGPKLIYPNQQIQHAGIILGVAGFACHAHHGLPRDDPGYFCRAQLAQEISAVTGACLLVRKHHFFDVGGLDEDHLAVSLNDVDFCLKLLSQGLRNIYVPTAVLVHHESFSRGYEDTTQKQRRFQSEINWLKNRWAEELLRDAAYNPNLSLSGRPFDLSWPSRAPLWDDSSS